MTLEQILRGIENAKATQEAEGAAHPGESFAFTFPVTIAQQFYLKRVKRIARLEFVDVREGRYLKTIGCYKPEVRHGV